MLKWPKIDGLIEINESIKRCSITQSWERWRSLGRYNPREIQTRKSKKVAIANGDNECGETQQYEPSLTMKVQTLSSG